MGISLYYNIFEIQILPKKVKVRMFRLELSQEKYNLIMVMKFHVIKIYLNDKYPVIDKLFKIFSNFQYCIQKLLFRIMK